MNKSISFVIADDHQIFLDGLVALFNRLEWVDLLGSANNGDDLLQLIEKHKPDIALIDLSMPGARSEKIISESTQKHPHTKLLALTMSKDAYKAQELLTLGLLGYVVKDTAFEDLLDGIKEVARGGQFISPSLIEEIRSLPKGSSEIHFTSREQEVLVCAAQGHGNKQIAYQLDISERTVCFHLANCFVKLNVHNRTEAIAISLSQGLISID